jgi:hypothetical protein
VLSLACRQGLCRSQSQTPGTPSRAATRLPRRRTRSTEHTSSGSSSHPAQLLLLLLLLLRAQRQAEQAGGCVAAEGAPVHGLSWWWRRRLTASTTAPCSRCAPLLMTGPWAGRGSIAPHAATAPLCPSVQLLWSVRVCKRLGQHLHWAASTHCCCGVAALAGGPRRTMPTWAPPLAPCSFNGLRSTCHSCCSQVQGSLLFPSAPSTHPQPALHSTTPATPRSSPAPSAAHRSPPVLQ